MRNRQASLDILTRHAELIDVDIIAVSEPPWILRRGWSPPGYRSLRAISPEPEATLAILLIRENLAASHIAVQSPRTAAAAVQLPHGRTLLVVSSYLQPTTGDGWSALQRWLSATRSSTDSLYHRQDIWLAGDFNSRHAFWGPPETQATNKAEDLIKLADDLNLKLQNRYPSPATFRGSAGESWIDLSWTRCHLADSMPWQVRTDLETFSDHQIVETIFPLRSPDVWRSEFRRNWRQADWAEIQKALHRRAPHLPTPKTLLQAPSARAFAAQVEALEEGIRQASFPAVPLTRRSSRRKHWWSDELENLHQSLKRESRRLERHIHRHGGAPLCLKDAVQSARQALQQKIRERKRATWRSFLVDNSSTTSTLWSTFKRITRSQTSTKLSFIQSEDDGVIDDPTRISQALFRKFFPTGESPAQPSSIIGPLICPPVTVAEARLSFDSGRPYAAPGPDEMPQALIRCAFRVLPQHFAALSTVSLQMGWIPDHWQQAVVVPIPKKQNPRQELALFRPISLIGTVAKNIHAIVTKRLAQWMETRSLLSPKQYGFRIGRGTSEALTSAVECIETHLGAHQAVYGVSLDITAAFDSLCPDAVIEVLTQYHAPDYCIRWCTNYFCNRRTRLDLEGGSFWHEPTRGTPQGSPLSPLLFIIGINPLLQLGFPPGISVQAYADDLLVLGHADTEELVQLRVQQTLSMMEQWTTQRGLHFSPAKSFQIRFTRFPRRIPPLPLFLRGEQLSVSSSVKYLGLILDSTLSWRQHVIMTAQKIKQRLQLIRRCTSSFWGLYPAAVETLVSKALEPAAFFGSECWMKAGASATVLAPLEEVMRQAALCITGGFRTTSYPSAFALAAMRPPAISLQINGLFYETRRWQLPDVVNQSPPSRSVCISSSSRRVALNRWNRSLQLEHRYLGAPLRYDWSHIPVHQTHLLEGDTTDRNLDRPDWLIVVALHRDQQSGWLGLSWRLMSTTICQGDCFRAPPWASENELLMSLLTNGLDALQRATRHSPHRNANVVGLLASSSKLKQEVLRLRHPSQLALGIQERLLAWSMTGNCFFWTTAKWAPGRSPLKAEKLRAQQSCTYLTPCIQPDIPPDLSWTRRSIARFWITWHRRIFVSEIKANISLSG